MTPDGLHMMYATVIMVAQAIVVSGIMLLGFAWLCRWKHT